MSDHHFIHPNPQHQKTTNGQANSDIEKFCDAKAQVIAQFEASYLKQLMSKTSGNISKAAQLAGKDRGDFGKLIKKHGIQRKNYL